MSYISKENYEFLLYAKLFILDMFLIIYIHIDVNFRNHSSYCMKWSKSVSVKYYVL